MRLCPAVALSTALAGLLHPAPLAAQDILLTEPGIGGLSAIEMRGDGASALVLSDRGQLHEVTFEREGGALGKARVTASYLLSGEGLDPEGLALFPGGDLAVSFEGNAPLRLYRGGAGAGQVPQRIPLPIHPALPPNAMYEALAVDPRGRLLMLPEDPGQSGPGYPLWRLEAGEWRQIAQLYAPRGYRPVGADFGPDGQLYLLLRALGLGFRNMILRFDPDHPEIPARRLLHLTGYPRSNFEGLSVWQDDSGQLRLTLVSDDNFSASLKSRFLEITLDLQGTSR